MDPLQAEVDYLRFRGFVIDGRTEMEQRRQALSAYLQLIAEDDEQKRAAEFDKFAADYLEQPR
jgi:hypothetical protein